MGDGIRTRVSEDHTGYRSFYSCIRERQKKIQEGRLNISEISNLFFELNLVKILRWILEKTFFQSFPKFYELRFIALFMV